VREVIGDLFSYPADATVVPINWRTRKNGDAVMGAGVAKQAAERWPWLPASLGNLILRKSPFTECLQATTTDGRLVYLLLVPTKHDWRAPSTVELVERGAKTMRDMADRHGWTTVALPRLGCGERTGQLSWPDQVRPLLAGILDDRFHVVTLARPDKEVW